MRRLGHRPGHRRADLLVDEIAAVVALRPRDRLEQRPRHARQREPLAPDRAAARSADQDRHAWRAMQADPLVAREPAEHRIQHPAGRMRQLRPRLNVARSHNV
jgi:hypothetical protein